MDNPTAKQKAIINDWCVLSYHRSNYGAPEQLKPILRGNVFDHPRHKDGVPVATSCLVSLDTHSQKAETMYTTYSLGQPASQWLQWIDECGYKLSDYNFNSSVDFNAERLK